MSRLRKTLVLRLAKLDVEDRAWPDRDDGFSALFYKGKEFAHFHNNNELDLRLTKSVIKREGLIHPSDSTTHPNRSKNSPWIEIRFTKAAHLAETIRLVELAIESI